MSLDAFELLKELQIELLISPLREDKWEEYALEVWRLGMQGDKATKRNLLTFIRHSFLDPFLQRYPELIELKYSTRFRRVFYNFYLELE